MKKILLLPLLLLTGCTATGETFNCTINGEDATFNLKDGIVTSYQIGEENSTSSQVDELNGEYFTTTTNNEEGKIALKNYIEQIGGTCDF